MNIQELVALVQRRWKVILAVVVAALAVAAALSFTTTPTYQSKARIYVGADAKTSDELFAAGAFGAARATSYAELATSQPVLSKVAHQLGSKEKAQTLAGQITSSVVPNTVIIEVGATADNARDAQRIARADAEQLSRYVSALETKKGIGIDARIVSPATLDPAKVTPRTTLNLVAAGVLGLLIGLAVAVAWDRLRADDEAGYVAFEDEDDDDEPVDEAHAVDEAHVNGVEQSTASTQV